MLSRSSISNRLWATKRRTRRELSERSISLGACLPPTLDVLIPHYLIIFLDSIGRRERLCKENPTWHALERAVVMSASYWRSDHDLSHTVAFINDHKFDAVYEIGSIIPPSNVPIIDNISSTAPYKNDDIKIYSNNFHHAVNIIKNNRHGNIPVHGLCEHTIRNGVSYEYALKVDIPPSRFRIDVPAFGLVSSFVASNSNLHDLLHNRETRI